MDKCTNRQITFTEKRGYAEGSFLAMGSPCEVLIHSADKHAANQAIEIVANEAWRIEDKFSRYLTGNVVDEINSSEGRVVRVDDETANLIDFACEIHALSSGMFDITSGVLREVWTFDGGDRLPDEDSVQCILENVGWRRVAWNRPSLQLRKGMQIDLGGIGKEYAVDKAASLILEHNDKPSLLNFGGDIRAVRPELQPVGWKVGIDAFDQSDAPIRKTISLKGGGIATSGDARRFVLKDGVRYGHILNPFTGWPVENAPRSVTVAADTCVQAGMLATLAILRGNEAESFLRSQNIMHWCFR